MGIGRSIAHVALRAAERCPVELEFQLDVREARGRARVRSVLDGLRGLAVAVISAFGTGSVAGRASTAPQKLPRLMAEPRSLYAPRHCRLNGERSGANELKSQLCSALAMTIMPPGLAFLAAAAMRGLRKLPSMRMKPKVASGQRTSWPTYSAPPAAQRTKR